MKTTTTTETLNNYCIDAYKKATTKHPLKHGYQNITFTEFMEIVKTEFSNKYNDMQFYENGKYIGFYKDGVINNLKQN